MVFATVLLNGYINLVFDKCLHAFVDSFHFQNSEKITDKLIAIFRAQMRVLMSMVAAPHRMVENPFSCKIEIYSSRS